MPVLDDQSNNHEPEHTNPERDTFRKSVFSSDAWSAPVMMDPAGIRDSLLSLHLEGRRIRRMKFIGLCYDLQEDLLEDHAYRQMEEIEGIDEEELQRRSEYNSIDPDMLFYRAAEVDEPFIIGFDDGETFEICTPVTPEYRFSMNRIPWPTKAGTNPPNAHADMLFSPCLGKTIRSVEVRECKGSDQRILLVRQEFEDRDVVSEIILWMEDGNGIRIRGWADFCEIDCVDAQGETLTMPFRELKPALFN